MKERFQGKNILITGGLGFIGSTLARRLVELGGNVTLMDSMIPKYGGNYFNIHGIENDVSITISDMRDEHSIKHLVQGKDFIFNLAGQNSHLDSMKEPLVDLDINAKAQLSFLEACRTKNPKAKIVYASTRQIYGRPIALPVNESHPIKPVDVNGINKTAGEWYHMLYHEVYGIPTTVLRLTNTFGPGMRIKDERQTFLGIWIRSVIEGVPFEVWGGEQLRDFNFVDDVVDAFLLSATHELAVGKVFNLGSEEVLSLKALAEMLVEVGNASYVVKPFPEERKKIDIGDYYADFSLIRNTLGWSPSTSIKDGIKKTISFYKKFAENYL